MPTKQQICLAILKRHGLLVQYSGKSLGHVPEETVPDETFGKWKKRVLGPGARDVVVFAPMVPSDRVRVSTLEERTDSEHVRKLLRSYGKRKDRRSAKEWQEARKDLYESFATVPLADLMEVVDGIDHLEPSLREFFQRVQASNREDVDTLSLLEPLIRAYNDAVRKYRVLSEVGGK